jgi:hypothetical protein
MKIPLSLRSSTDMFWMAGKHASRIGRPPETSALPLKFSSTSFSVELAAMPKRMLLLARLSLIQFKLKDYILPFAKQNSGECVGAKLVTRASL